MMKFPVKENVCVSFSLIKIVRNPFRFKGGGNFLASKLEKLVIRDGESFRNFLEQVHRVRERPSINIYAIRLEEDQVSYDIKQFLEKLVIRDGESFRNFLEQVHRVRERPSINIYAIRLEEDQVSYDIKQFLERRYIDCSDCFRCFFYSLFQVIRVPAEQRILFHRPHAFLVFVISKRVPVQGAHIEPCILLKKSLDVLFIFKTGTENSFFLPLKRELFLRKGNSFHKSL